MERQSSELSYYEYGKSTLFACQFDHRFSYCTYVPENYGKQNVPFHLAVIVHGTNRTAQGYRDQFIEFAERTNTIILSPLFPAGITKPGELDSYKFVSFEGIRFDQVLLAMVKEVVEKYHLASDKFLLHGFSGGGQFAHRFLYIHPQRLLGVSIGAPGYITYLDSSRPWHVGTNTFEDEFGCKVQLESMRKVPIQLVVGSEDTDTWEINDKEDDVWMDGVDAHGKTRIDRLKALHRNYEQFGLNVRYSEVPGVGHEGFKILPFVKEFFTSILQD